MAQGSSALDSARRRPYLVFAMAKKQEPENYKVIAENRRARYDYAIEDDLECGIQLMGSEVKSLRTGQSNIAESYAAVEDGELWLVNSYIAPYEQAMFGPEDRRRRKLLVSRKGIAKVKIGLAKGKKTHDKRETEAKRDWSRQKQRLLKDHG